MKPEYKQLKQDILFEQAQVEAVVSKIKSGLKGKIPEPQLVATAAYLMNFYNGIENIMKRCAKEYYKKMPKGHSWHKQLLELSCSQEKNRIPLFPKDVVNKLYDYLAFRHFFIHGYGFKLDWEKIAPLADALDELWAQIKDCISEFIKKI